MADPKAQAAALRNQGNELVKKKDYEGALKCYNDCVKLDPTDAAAHSNKAMIYLKRNIYDRALDAAESALKANPGFYKAHQRMAEAYLGMGETKQAFIRIRAALKKDPSNQQAQEIQDRVREKLKQEGLMIDDKEIDEEADRVLEGPAGPVPMEAESHKEEDKSKSAKMEGEASSAAVESFFGTVNKLKEEAKVLHSNGKYDEAMGKYLEALKVVENLKRKGRKDISDKEFVKREMVLNRNIAATYKQKQDPQGVKLWTTKVINCPTVDLNLKLKALTMRAYAYEELDKLKDAREDWLKVKELSPENIVASSCLARIQTLIAKDTAAASEEKLRPLMAELEEYKKKGNDAFKASIHNKFSFASFCPNLSYFLENLEKAIEEFSKGIEIFKAKADMTVVKSILNKDKTALAAQLFTNRSLCYFNLNKFVESMNDAKFVLENIDYKNAKAYFRKGMAESKLDGMMSEALKDLEEACRLDPSADSYTEALKALKGGKKKK